MMLHVARVAKDLTLAVFLLTFLSTALSAQRLQRNPVQMSIDKAMIPTYDSLAKRAIENFSRKGQYGQYWICIAGGPGAGKSTLAAAVSERINSEAKESGFSVVIPMDGFHYSRQQLREMAERKSSQYTFDDLIARRGSPWTFDAPSICEYLTTAREHRYGSFPVYSRKLSDPVPDGVQLLESNRIILVEGNYMLNYEDPLWAPLQPLFDEKWYIACKSLDDQRERLINRHLETWTSEKTRMWGEGREGATRKADANDVLNAQFISNTAKFADLVIESI